MFVVVVVVVVLVVVVVFVVVVVVVTVVFDVVDTFVVVIVVVDVIVVASLHACLASLVLEADTTHLSSANLRPAPELTQFIKPAVACADRRASGPLDPNSCVPKSST